MILPAGAEKYTQLHRTRGSYVDSVQADFHELVEHLPDNVYSVLDIGCGLGGIDVCLQGHYPDAVFHLMDGTGMTEVRVGYHDDMDPYNDMALTRQCMSINGVNAQFYDIDTELDIKADLVISLFSWCFHYPAKTYRDMVIRSGAHTVIADVRSGRPIPFADGVKIIDHGKGSSRMIWGNIS